MLFHNSQLFTDQPPSALYHVAHNMIKWIITLIVIPVALIILATSLLEHDYVGVGISLGMGLMVWLLHLANRKRPDAKKQARIVIIVSGLGGIVVLFDSLINDTEVELDAGIVGLFGRLEGFKAAVVLAVITALLLFKYFRKK